MSQGLLLHPFPTVSLPFVAAQAGRCEGLDAGAVYFDLALHSALPTGLTPILIIDSRRTRVLNSSRLCAESPQHPHHTTTRKHHMAAVRPVVRRGRFRESRHRSGIKVGRRGLVSLTRNGQRIVDRSAVLSAIGRKV